MKKTVIISTLIIIIFSGCKRFPSLGNGYKLDYSGRSNNIVLIDSNNNVIVGDHILNYNYDRNLIVVEKKPPDSIPDPTHNFGDWEIAYLKSTFRQYWIIDKKTKSIFDKKTMSYSNVYRPLKKEEYLKKLEQLKVPKELKLRE